jgi:hypothetical protein
VLLRQQVRVGEASADGWWSAINAVPLSQPVSFDVSGAEVYLAKKAVMLRQQVMLTTVLLKDIQPYT